MVFHIRPNAICYHGNVLPVGYVNAYSYPIVTPFVVMETTSHATEAFAVRDLRGRVFFSEGYKRYRGQNRGKIRYKRSPCLGNTAEFTLPIKTQKKIRILLYKTHTPKMGFSSILKRFFLLKSLQILLFSIPI